MDAETVDRDVVFVSYSHQDAAWAQRFGVLLKPLVRRKRLKLWIDADLRAGDAWRSEIVRGVRRSRVALLLVSADFLASDFIMETELPALTNYGVRLAPVLVGECMWQHEETLAEVQWLHDVGAEGALNVGGNSRGRRDQRLREVCERLLDLIPLDADPMPVAPSPVVDAAPVAQVPTGEVQGGIFGVPPLPRGYVARDELAGLADAVVDVDGGAVGLTGDTTAVGLHGQGGIGKSVLAAALARDAGIGRRFPDGVYWVTVGERPDVLGVQLGLLERLGFREMPPRTVTDATDLLRKVLADRRVLLVVDDVWTTAAAAALRVTGIRGRIVYTSRDPGVVVAVGARAHRIGVLSPGAAKALAAGVLEISPDRLPPTADRVLAGVGRVALAVALLAAAVRGGRSWSQIADDLEREGDALGDHPYANTFKAMQIAVDGLSTASVDALLSLAVFPPDTQVPVAAIIRYWGYTRGYTTTETVDELSRFATAGLLHRIDGRIEFHDLQHEYLLLHAPLLTDLHAALLDAYEALLPVADEPRWWQLPVDEPYVGNHLIAHLHRAGRDESLVANVTDPAYLARRIAGGGPHAAGADLAHAATVFADDAKVLWWQGWLTRHTHLLSAQPDSRDTDVTATMLAWLEADSELGRRGIDVLRLGLVLPDRYLRVRWGLSPPPQTLIMVLAGHADAVTAVAWSPDGKEIASASAEGFIQIWNTSDGTPLVRVRVEGGAESVAWSPSGVRIVGAGGDGALRVWYAATGEPVTALTGHVGVARSVAWSPDAARLASGADDATVRIWDAATGGCLAVLSGHRGPVLGVAWSPDSSDVASVSADQTLRVWSGTGHGHSTELHGHIGKVNAVSWSPDGRTLATADGSGAVRLWVRTDSWSLRSNVSGHASWALAVAWSPEGSRFASAGTDKFVRVWDATGGKRADIAGHITGVSTVQWSPDGVRLASGSDDRSVRIWHANADRHDGGSRDGGPQRSRSTQSVRSVAWSPDGRELAGVNRDGSVEIWRAANGRLSPLLARNLRGESVVVAWSPDGTQFAAASRYGGISLWDRVTGNPVADLDGRAGEAQVLAWSPDSTQLLLAGADGTIEIWQGVGRRPLLTDQFEFVVGAVTWSRDSMQVACACLDGSVRLIDTSRAQPWWRPRWLAPSDTSIGRPGPGRSSAAMAWSPGGRRLAHAAKDGSIRVWDSGSEQVVARNGHGQVSAMAWSPDGAWLAWGGPAGVLVVQPVDAVDQRRCLQLDPITCLSWAAAGIAVGRTAGLVVVDLDDVSLGSAGRSI